MPRLFHSVVTMSRAWAVLKAHPYVGNMVGYTALFASADILQQSVLQGGGGPGTVASESGDSPQVDSSTAGIDWSQTAKVALVGFCFHANFNYHWLRGLERLLPGGGLRKITLKVGLDQLVAAPATISAFFIGEWDAWHSRDDCIMTTPLCCERLCFCPGGSE